MRSWEVAVYICEWRSITGPLRRRKSRLSGPPISAAELLNCNNSARHFQSESVFDLAKHLSNFDICFF